MKTCGVDSIYLDDVLNVLSIRIPGVYLNSCSRKHLVLT